MDPTSILISTAALGGIGAAAAALLAGASRIFHVEEDPRIAQINDILPGANCGGCGYPGCPGFAAALVKGEADPSACAPGGSETAKKIGEILGVAVTEKEKVVARLHCQGAPGVCNERAVYAGFESCKSVMLLMPGGTKACPQGCEGLGDCVTVCAFDAIRIGDNRLPVVDEDKCTGCGKCVTACPKAVLHMEPQAQKLLVACSTKLAAKLVRKACSTGCIQCKLCVRTCPYDALVWENGLPQRVDEKCKACGLCVDACKPKSLTMLAEPSAEAKEAAQKLVAERKAAEAAKKAAAKAAAAPKAEAKPAEAKPAEAKPAEAKPAEAKPAEAKPAEAKPAEAKPAEAKPAEAKPAESEKKEGAAEGIVAKAAGGEKS